LQNALAILNLLSARKGAYNRAGQDPTEESGKQIKAEKERQKALPDDARHLFLKIVISPD
jgi:hypothetical protein